MITKSTVTRLALGAALVTGAASLAKAQDSGPLVEALVRKGILSDQEAEEIRADLLRDFGGSSAGKLDVSSSLTQLKISGDARVRYEYRTGENGGNGDKAELNRFRYRLRLGLTGKFGDGWFFGTRLETATSNRSTNVTAGNNTAPFTKNGDNALEVGQLYIGRTWEDFVFTAGRMANPLVTTSMVWDDDINPEGLAEQWSHTTGDVTWMANLGQFVYEGSGTTNPFGSGANRPNTYLWAFQGGGKVKLGETTSLQVMPTYYAYSRTNTGAAALTTANSKALLPAGLSIIEVPVELSFKIKDLPAKVFADYAINTDADVRAKAAGKPAFDGEDTAYMVGVGVGASKAKGDWELKTFWQSVDAFALDTNLVDSDLFEGRTNMEGYVVTGTYVISNGVSVKFTYADANRKNDSLITYGGGDLSPSSGAVTDYKLFQADLNVKF